MIERVDSRKPQDSYNYPGDVNVHSPTVVKKDGSWKWFKDGRLQKDNSVSYDNHSLSQRRRVKNRRWSDVHPFDAAKMNREKLKPARNKYIDHAQSKVPEGSVPNENNKQPQVKKLMEDWGSEYGKNPDIKKHLRENLI